MRINPIKSINTFIKAFPEQKFVNQMIDINKSENIKLGGDSKDDNKLYCLA